MRLNCQCKHFCNVQTCNANPFIPQSPLPFIGTLFTAFQNINNLKHIIKIYHSCTKLQYPRSNSTPVFEICCFSPLSIFPIKHSSGVIMQELQQVFVQKFCIRAFSPVHFGLNQV
ncbi:hypothetical protein GOP47_0012192 [Adiantum capillus-veneris]|uniref:Uncharacterized protein n=1 Tax=Adiantum capillus-veneris TaxID=13818 RepID=A0A9D4ZGN2_ADICA|nr:hypothetical protein GOP47_0012192 [Adiantum capillus-veneris]